MRWDVTRPHIGNRVLYLDIPATLILEHEPFWKSVAVFVITVRPLMTYLMFGQSPEIDVTLPESVTALAAGGGGAGGTGATVVPDWVVSGPTVGESAELELVVPGPAVAASGVSVAPAWVVQEHVVQ